ncbi:3-phosphoshikimate 1-carboxyvinyltransferase [Candidatus Peregrinibacteria bacterium CG11_big_fil_rev_8_21_14_0_20_46_8]|nr:MAG: 3-phosphoshikimate 1-carboxyvinyltransferase [Candidatus Peregrinibacteria bacterium CG11_big_fil_rev_8_21_14_0_20_46_8]
MITVNIPGSKSISNRALLLASLAGPRKIAPKNLLQSDDTKYMQQALKALKKGKKSLYCGNAGTAMRFLAAYVATLEQTTTLNGNARMRERPIKDLVDALRQLGAEVEYLKHKGYPPLRIRGPLLGGTCTLQGTISSQYLSGLLMAAPLAKKNVTIHIRGGLVSKPYVDMTISMMETYGVKVARDGYKSFRISAGQKYKARSYTIEPDASSASYFYGIGMLTQNKMHIPNLDLKNSLQADVRFVKAATALQAKKMSRHIDCESFPDAAMTLVVLAAFTKGKSEFTGLGNLRVKECDRLSALATELKRIGCRVTEKKEGIIVYGNPEKLHGAPIRTYDDHRMAMCFGMASVLIPDITIENPQCVKKTFPTFFIELKKVKKQLNEQNIILSGMRGCGKSTLAKALAKKMKREYIDLDTVIEKRAGKTIAEIVAAKGWNYFRTLEAQAVTKISRKKNIIIAVGGGTVLFQKNVKQLKQHGKIIYLNCSVSSIQKALAKNKHRPSVTKESVLEEAKALYAKRHPIYAKNADVIISGVEHTTNKEKDLTKKVAKLSAHCAYFGIHETV